MPSAVVDASKRLQIVDDRFGGVRFDRNSETYSGALPDARGDHCINANNFAVPVEQRAARVAGIDGRIRLNRFVDHQSVELAPGESN